MLIITKKDTVCLNIMSHVHGCFNCIGLLITADNSSGCLWTYAINAPQQKMTTWDNVTTNYHLHDSFDVI